jgi:hypothetical protein
MLYKLSKSSFQGVNWVKYLVNSLETACRLLIDTLYGLVSDLFQISFIMASF